MTLCSCSCTCLPPSKSNVVDGKHNGATKERRVPSSYAPSSDEEGCPGVVMEREEAKLAVASLQLQVRTLHKYKSNYELLCVQLSELKDQIGLQLQRHEADVTVLQASLADLQTEKLTLEAQVAETQEALAMERQVARQHQAYSKQVHEQLKTTAELLQATEERLEEQEQEFAEQVAHLKPQLEIREDKCAQYQNTIEELEEERRAFQTREVAGKEQKNKYKKELMNRAMKLQALGDELETQRAALRAAKKELTTMRDENDALRKQVTNMKRDGVHLSHIIDSQRAKQESYAEELVQIKKAKKQLAKQAAIQLKEREKLGQEVAQVKDELYRRKQELEECRKERNRLRQEMQQTGHQLVEMQSKYDKIIRHTAVLQKPESKQLVKANAREKAQQERQCRQEVTCMRELLEDNQQRATNSSKEIQRLRRELLSVQKLLRSC